MMHSSLYKPLLFGAGIAAVALGAGVLMSQQLPSAPMQAYVDVDHLDRTRLPFVANMGQFDEPVQFVANLFSGTFFVADDELVYTFSQGVLRESFVDAQGNQLSFDAEAGLPAPAEVNYYIGDDASQWKEHIKSYHTVSLGSVYPGVAVELQAYANNVEKIFTVAPHTDPSIIRLQLVGADSLSVGTDGQLLVHTAQGDMAFTAPKAWQDSDTPVEARYTVDGTTYGFSLGTYDASKPVYIDPLVASTYMGGTDGESAGLGITLDDAGNVYVTGYTFASDFPVAGDGDAFPGASTFQNAIVSKLTPTLDGTTLLASTYIGGSFHDNASDLVIDSSGDVFVIGTTQSTNFPVTGAGTSSEPGDATSQDFFLARFSSTLNLEVSTYYGTNNGADIGAAIALTSGGNVVVSGYTFSSSFTVVGGLADADPTLRDGYIAIVPPALNVSGGVIASTYLGGTGEDWVTDILVDPSNNVYVSGYTDSTNFPVAGGGTTNQLARDAYVTRFNSALSSISASTYLGGSGSDLGRTMAMDTGGNLFIGGETASTNFPVAGDGVGDPGDGDSDVFVSKFTTLTTPIASTYIGGSGYDTSDGGLAVDSTGAVYVVGYTFGTDYPIAGDGVSIPGGLGDGILTKLSPTLDATNLLGSTYIGGADGDDYLYDVVVDSSGTAYVTGDTYATNFPATGDGVGDPGNGGSDDLIIARYFFGSQLGLSLSNSQRGASNVQHTFTINPSVSLSSGSKVVLTFPAGYSATFANLTNGDINVSGTGLTGYTTTFDDASNRLTIELTIPTTLDSDLTITIGDGAGGGLNDLSNPATQGVYGIGMDVYDTNDLLLEQGLFSAEVDNLVQITALVTEALIMTLTGNTVTLQVDPAVNSGVDDSQYTGISIYSNAAGGYTVAARLDDGSNNAQLTNGAGGNIATGTGDGTFGYDATNAAYDSNRAVDGTQPFGSTNTPLLDGTSAEIGFNNVADPQPHTVYYDLDVNFLTPAGIYTGTIYYTALASF